MATLPSTYFLIGSDDRVYELPADKGVMIGRSPINQIVLDDRIASRVHAHITPSPKGPRLTDRDSANGTYVNGRRVRETILNHGDTIQMSKFVFDVLCGTAQDARDWLARRKTATESDQTITGLNNSQPRETDLVGDLSAVQILTLIQTLVDQKRPGALALTQYGRRLGEIHFTNGTIVYAETATGLKGKEAALHLMIADQGQFTFRPDAQPPALAMMDPPAVLIEQARRLIDAKRLCPAPR